MPSELLLITIDFALLIVGNLLESHSGLTYSRVFRLPVITLTQNGAKAEQNTNCKISIFFKCIIGQLMPNFGWDFGAPIGSQFTPQISRPVKI